MQVRKRRMIIGLAVLLVVAMIPMAALAAGGTFTDDDTSVFEADIEWLAGAGVTLGCNPPTNDQFCPEEAVKRGQMAAFMRRFAQFLGAEDGIVSNADDAKTLDGYGPGQLGLIKTTSINAQCPFSSVSFTGSFTKIGNIGTFEKDYADSEVVVSFNGRVYAASVNGTGARFELRVDDAATTEGRIRASMKDEEMGGGTGIPVTMQGVFDNLGAGTHTVSMWVESSGTTGSGGMWDPGCWSSDHVLIEEYGPAK